MAKTKLRHYKIAVGSCGHKLNFSGIIEAHSAEEAATLLLGKDAPKRSLDETAHRMREIPEEWAYEHFIDCRQQELDIGDSVYAVVKQKGKAPEIRMATIERFTNCGVKVTDGENMYQVVTGMYDHINWGGSTQPYFKRLIKVTKNMAPDTDICVGDNVAYMGKVLMNTCPGFLFGTVIGITDHYMTIRSDSEGEVRKATHRVCKLFAAK